MVRKDMKISILEKISEVLDSQIYSQQLSIVRTVTGFRWLQGFGKKC